MENPFVIAAGVLLALVLATVDNPMYAPQGAQLDTKTETASIETACQPYTTTETQSLATGPIDLEYAFSDVSTDEQNAINGQ